MTYTRHEGFFESFDHTRLFYQSWTQPDSVATILITHGQGEHSDCYNRLIDYFEKSKFDFYAYDLRGHGKSAGLRGYAESFDHYVHDTQKFYELIEKKETLKKPMIALGHSMGGLIQTLTLLQTDQKRFALQVLSAPLFGVAVHVPAFKKHGAQILEKYLPKLTLGNEVDYEMLTREPAILREYEKDSLRHDRISSGVYNGFVKHFETVKHRAREILLPTLLVCSENDPIISSEACQSIFTEFSSEIKKSHFYGQGAKHELFNDTIRNEVYADMARFLDSQLGAL